MIEFALELFEKSIENHEISGNNAPKSFQNRPKAAPKAMKMVPWTVFGAKSRPGRLPDVPGQPPYSFFFAFFAENDAPRVDLSCLRQIPAPGPRKVSCERKLAFHGGAVSHVRVFFELDVKKNRKSRKQVWERCEIEKPFRFQSIFRNSGKKRAERRSDEIWKIRKLN